MSTNDLEIPSADTAPEVTDAPAVARLRLAPQPPLEPTPASVGRRFVAVFVDMIILSVMSMPLSIVLRISSGLSFRSSLGAGNDVGRQIIYLAMSYLVSLTLSFVYHAWFYQNRGATPGKLLMGLRVVHRQTGANLSYGQTFLRELLAKPFLTFLPFFAGVFVALFRKDHCALHDLAVKTQVIRIS